MSFLRTLLGLRSDPEKAKPQAAKNGAETVDHPVAIGSEGLGELAAFMKGMLGCLATERLGQLTLREAITRFVDGKPERPYPVRGALIVQPHREGKQVVWAFLDRDDNLELDGDGRPLGRKAICAGLDEELDAMMAGRELLIVE